MPDRRRLLAAALVAALGVALAASPAVAEPPDALTVVHASYGPDPAQRLTVFEPPGAGMRPAVLYVHGGCWLQRYAKHVEAALARRIAEETGWVVGVLDYRTSAPRWRVEPDDVAAGLRLLRHGGFGVDPAHVALWGESAGAHLSLLTGLTALGPDRPSAVVSVSGPTDMRAELASGGVVPMCVMAFEGGPPDADTADRYTATSPADRVQPGAPAVFLATSTGDPQVPASQTAELAARLAQADVPHREVFVPGDDHAFMLEKDRPAGEGACVRQLAERFLAGFLG